MESKTYRTCLDPALDIVIRIRAKLPNRHYFKVPLGFLSLELKFFKMFFWGLEFLEETGKDSHLSTVIRNMGSEFREAVEEFEADTMRAIRRRVFIKNWEHWASPLVDKIKHFKPQVIESCIVFLGGRFKCKSFNDVGRSAYARETGDFIDWISFGLWDLNDTIDQIDPVKQQYAFIEGKLNLFQNLLSLVSRWRTKGKVCDELLLHTRAWANHISCLACLYWTTEIDQSLVGTVGTMLSDLMRRTMPPEVVASYLYVLKEASKYRGFEATERNRLARVGEGFVDFLFESFDMPAKEDDGDVEIFREGLIFLLAFASDPPEDDSECGKLILRKIDAIISEAPCVVSSIHFEGPKDGLSVSKAKLSDFLQKVDGVKTEVRELYVQTPDSSRFAPPPRTGAIGFLDFLLANLKKMLEAKLKFIAGAKHLVRTAREELALLRPFLCNIMDLQNAHKEFNDLSMRIINLLYYTESAINSLSVDHISLWYKIVCLSKAIQDIKLIQIEAKEIEDYRMYNTRKLNAEIESTDALLQRATTSVAEGALVGFKEEEKSIRDHLLGRRKELTVISISGMPGQGKTTLAKAIYNDHSIQYRFDKTAWCYVSKECKVRNLLIEIAKGVSDVDYGSNLDLEIQDLAERLRKSLKGRRYLIVMDDIWDVDVWRKVEGAFPNDRKGSRIMFTSRNHDLVSQVKVRSIPCPLRLLSEDEGWELMKVKLFNGEEFPDEFQEIGKQIAVLCKGLPLSVVLMASLLGRKRQNLDFWKQVAENLPAHLASEEGCMHIIELSYKYLPEHLKSCFLYFGAFPRGANVSAKLLKLLWIAEGFVNENEKQSSEDLANEYLHELISQSLVDVHRKNSDGGVKFINVHDLLYDLCLLKAVDENFLKCVDESAVYQYSASPQKYDYYRLSFTAGDPLKQPGSPTASVPLTHPRPVCNHAQSLLSTDGHHWLAIVYSLFHGKRLQPRGDTWIPFLEGFQLVKVLDLSNIYLGKNFPGVILSMVHLRYLGIWAYIKNIPPSIADLWNLEALIVKNSALESWLPDTIFKMKCLRYVDINRCNIPYTLFESSAVNNIETLYQPTLWCNRGTEDFFIRSPRLRKLRCYLCEPYNQHCTWFSMFGYLNKLETLRVHFSGEHPSFEKFPVFPENLKKLTLSGFHLPWSAMSTIGRMPNLEVLKLKDQACEGTKWDLEDGEFPNVRFLELQDLDFQQINVSGEPFPCLEELLVHSCDYLEEIPSIIGDICNLKTIRVLKSSEGASDSARRILEEQRELGNDYLQVVVVESETDSDEDHDDDHGDVYGDDNDDNNNNNGDDDQDDGDDAGSDSE